MLGIISRVVGGGHVSIRIGIMNVDIAPAGCQETVKSIYSRRMRTQSATTTVVYSQLVFTCRLIFIFYQNYLHVLFKQVNSGIPIKQATMFVLLYSVKLCILFLLGWAFSFKMCVCVMCLFVCCF